MELVVRGFRNQIYDVVFGERLYHSNFQPIFTPPYQRQNQYSALAIDDWSGEPFDFNASVSGIDSRIVGQWNGNQLSYSMGNYAELNLEFAPVSLATLTLHESVHTLHAKQLQNEVLLGVSAILDHAYHQLPSLHAAAVEHQGEAILLIGESSRGKSTLARELNGLNGIFSLADDMCLIDPQKNEIITNIPQLKIDHYYYPAARNRPRYPIKAVFFLAKPQESVYAIESDKPTTLLKFMRHTACIRLMPKQLQAHLLPLYGQNLADKPSFQLHYPRKFDIFQQVADEICTALEKV